jgi:hypothetical protein
MWVRGVLITLRNSCEWMLRELYDLKLIWHLKQETWMTATSSSKTDGINVYRQLVPSLVLLLFLGTLWSHRERQSVNFPFVLRCTKISPNFDFWHRNYKFPPENQTFYFISLRIPLLQPWLTVGWLLVAGLVCFVGFVQVTANLPTSKNIQRRPTTVITWRVLPLIYLNQSNKPWGAVHCVLHASDSPAVFWFRRDLIRGSLYLVIDVWGLDPSGSISR